MTDPVVPLKVNLVFTEYYSSEKCQCMKHHHFSTYSPISNVHFLIANMATWHHLSYNQNATVSLVTATNIILIVKLILKASWAKLFTLKL